MLEADGDIDLEDSLAPPPTARPKTASKMSSEAEQHVRSSTSLLLSDTILRSSTTALLDQVIQEAEETYQPATKNGALLEIENLHNGMQPNYQPNLSTRPIEVITPQVEINGKMKTPPPLDSLLSKIQSEVLLKSVKVISLELVSSWGDVDYIGLSGVEILGEDGQPLIIAPRQVKLTSAFEDYSGMTDGRGVENLVNNINDVSNSNFMWLAVKGQNGKNPTVTIDLQQSRNIAGFR